MRRSLPARIDAHPGLLRKHRPNVAAVIVNANDQILWCERLHLPGSWQFPQGGIDRGEDVEDALWRELHEELGLVEPRRHLAIEERLAEPLRYDFPIELVASFLERRGESYLGQAQHYFRLRWSGDDALLTLAPPAGESREFSQWTWGDHRYLQTVPPFKRGVMTRALQAMGLAPNHPLSDGGRRL